MPVAILLSTAVIVPFGYFFWKSLTLRVGDTWPMFLWPAGFAAAAINIAMLPREGFPAWMIQIDDSLGEGCGCLRHRLRRRRISLLRRHALEFDRPDRSDRRRGRLSSRSPTRAQAAVAKDRRDLDRHHGLPHLCHAALAFQGPRAGDPDQRARPVPGLSRSRHGPRSAAMPASMSDASPTIASRCGIDDGEAAAARTGRAQLARNRDGYLCAGEVDRLDAGAFAAAGFAAVPLAGAGGRDERSRLASRRSASAPLREARDGAIVDAES